MSTGKQATSYHQGHKILLEQVLVFAEQVPHPPVNSKAVAKGHHQAKQKIPKKVSALHCSCKEGPSKLLLPAIGTTLWRGSCQYWRC